MKASKKTNKPRLLSLLVMLCMVVSLLPITASAATENNATESNWEISKSKTATPTETQDANQKFTVTLGLPAAEYENMYDIVFVIDDSNSTNNANFRTEAAALLQSLYDQNCNVKVGIVGFKGKAQDIIHKTDSNYSGLTLIDDTNKETVLKAVKETSASGSGTNVHGGLRLAQKWLDEDTNTPDENKYVILLTDCRTYIWDDEQGTPTTIYAQYSQKLKAQQGGWPSANQLSNYDKNAYIGNFPQEVKDKAAPFRFTTTKLAGTPVYNSYLEVFNGLYNSTIPELTSVTKYDTPIDFTNWTWGYLGRAFFTPDGSVAIKNIANTSGGSGQWISASFDYDNYYAFTRTTGSTIPNEVTWMEMNPYEIVENDDGTASYDYTKLNEDCFLYHISNLEKGVYKAAHLWTDLNEKYNCYSVIYKKGAGSGLDTALGMRDWLLEKDASGNFVNSDYGADATVAQSVAALFDSMEKEILYLVNKGTLTDVIGDDFDLLMGASGECPFALTVSGEPLQAVKDPGAANKWNFIVDDTSSSIPYSVTYDPNGAEGETFVLSINVPVKTAEPVQLSYKLQFADPANLATGVYPTNKYAKLAYESHDGTQGEEDFEVPEVHYSKQIGPGPGNPNEGNDGGDAGSITDGGTTGNTGSNNSGITASSGQTSLSKTGDNSNVFLWIALLLVSGGIIVIICVDKRKRARSKK